MDSLLRWRHRRPGQRVRRCGNPEIRPCLAAAWFFSEKATRRHAASLKCTLIFSGAKKGRGMPRPIPPPLNVTLKILRDALGWTQRDLSQATGIPHPVLSDLE